MFKGAIWQSDNTTPRLEGEEDAIDPALIQEELRRIVSSRHFQTSRRGKEFLQYVVIQKINGNGDLLKERLIGVQIFGRKPDYSTGDDPIVRVQAGDVRHRLERYHADPTILSDVLIDIPLGSYVPVFRLRRADQAKERSTDETAQQVPALRNSLTVIHSPRDGIQSTTVGQSGLGERTEASVASEARSAVSTYPSVAGDLQVASPVNGDVTPPPQRRRHRTMLKLALIPFLVCLALASYLVRSYFQKSPESVLKAFWLPAAVSSKPVLVCMPNPMVYKPSDKLFDKYRESHPDTFLTREARQDQILPLKATDTIQWGDLIQIRSSGPGIGGIIAAINISKLLTEQHIPFELRFGDEATYAEMRESPVVIIGSIDTQWANQLTSELKFVFAEAPGEPNIHEIGGAKRVWKMETVDGNISRDYGMVTRQLSGKAGQFLIQVAGVTHFGTEAAGDLLADKKEFAKILSSESITLQAKNLQIVVSTDVTAGRAGPPHVVAIRSW